MTVAVEEVVSQFTIDLISAAPKLRLIFLPTTCWNYCAVNLRYFTKKEGTAKVIQWCLCKSVDDGRPMIKCDGDDCPTEWFHFECVGLEDTPSCPWYCCECKPNI
nr:unnamed protein product [Callosobruchus chinensis]